MKSGRELDALVAEHVMGWNLYQGAWFGPQLEPHGEGYKCEVNDFQPSTDIAAAWEVLNYLNKKGFEDQNIHRCDAVWEVFISDYTDEGAVLVKAETAPHAICLAALKVVGYKDE